LRRASGATATRIGPRDARLGTWAFDAAALERGAGAVKANVSNASESPPFAVNVDCAQGLLMHLVTNLGDLVVLLPASLGLIVFLARVGARQDAMAYAAALAVCLTAALFAKLAIAACGEQYAVLGVESPSGHVAFSATFYGCLAALLGAGRTIVRRLTLYAGAAALVAAIGASRIALEAHTAPEVFVGAAIGAASIALFVALRARPERLALSPRSLLRMSPLAALYALCVLLLAGHWTAEPLIDAIAAQIGASLHLCR
jgi:membrane-associated phospholipid phosphatase